MTSPPRSECVEESKPLKDPGVVGARMHTSRVGCPADSADRPGELEFALASGLSLWRAGTRAVDRDDRRRIRNDEVNDLLARHAALERHDTAIIDDRGVKALPLSAHINADPQCHESKHAPPSTSALWADAEDLAGPRLPSARPQLDGRAQRSRGTRPSRCQQRNMVLRDCGWLGGARSARHERSVSGR